MWRIIIIFLLSFTIIVQVHSQGAPDFEYVNQEGHEAKLSNHQGEVLYVSFWASWCKPCISNFKKYASMREQLDSLGITLLNVNIDKTSELWKRALTKHHINGVHVRGKNIEVLKELYKLYSIPAYEIINKAGQFVYLSDAPDRNIIDEFQSWIKE